VAERLSAGRLEVDVAANGLVALAAILAFGAASDKAVESVPDVRRVVVQQT
jgi:hypothetical protein